MEARVLRHDDRGTGDPLVLIPGGLTGWLSWLPHQERLAERRRVVRVQPIHNELGSKGMLGDRAYTAEIERESLLMTFDALDLERPDLAAWSAGGLALIDFAIDHPDRVRTLTLVEPAAYWVLERFGEALPEVERSNAFIHGLFGRHVDEDELATFLRLGGLAGEDEDVRSHPGWGRWAEHRMTLSWLSHLVDRPNRTIEDLAAITAPVLLTKGTDSAPLDRRVVDVLGERLPDARVHEFRGDHAHHIEELDAFLEVLEAHLSPTPR